MPAREAARWGRAGERPDVGSGAGITVREALQLAPLAECRLVAGAAGLDRVISVVNVIEVPDIVEWVVPGEFLFTTGYPFRNDPDLQRRLVPGLASRRAAGLAVKPKRYVDRIPEAMLAEADALALPLVEVPFDLSFALLIRPILEAISARETMALHQIEHVQRNLMDLVLRGGDLNDLCTAAAGLVGGRVAIEDALGRVTAQAGEGRTETVSVPVAAGTHFLGRICVAPGGPLSPLDMRLLDHVAAIVALQLSKREAVEEVERSSRTQFLQQLLLGELEDPGEARERARVLGWNFGQAHAVVVVDVPPGGPRDAAPRVLQYALTGDDGRVPAVVPRPHGAAALVPHADRAALAAAGRVILQHLPAGRGIAVGVGRACDPLRDAKRSYREACTAALVARARGESGPTFFDDVGVFRFLYNQPLGELRAFCAEQLGRLGDSLVQTLEAYFVCGGNVRRVAATLHTHYNTVANRLRRIERLTGKDLQDADACLSLQVALAIRKLLREG